jgi:6,7-dimethyl-8-ribityllumazine synthase
MATERRKPADRETKPDARGLRVALVVSDYHREVTHAMADGARAAFATAGGAEADLLVAETPGAFELPVVAAAYAARADVTAVVALGCVVRGETRHDRYLNQAVTDALARLSVHSGKAIGYGLLTVESLKQARARAGGKQGNKGADAMVAALLTARLLQRAAQ